MIRIRGALCALLFLGASAVLSAQSWRTFDTGRQLRDSTAIAVHVSYGAGHVTVRPDQSHNLYDVHLKYDADRSEPLYRFDASTRRLEVGVRNTSVGKTAHANEGGELRVDLARSAPLRLDLDVGAAEGDFDLSGLQLSELALKTGATETVMHFDTPNPVRMHSFRMDVGAAESKVTGLGNANVEHVDVNLGVGSVTLDFGGAWRGDVDMTVNSALGEVTVNVPSDIGIRVESSTFLHSLDAAGLVKKDGNWVSDNWDTARYKLRLRSTGALGELKITRGGS